VVVIYVVVCGSFFEDVKPSNGIEVGAFDVGVQNLHAFLYVAKCVLLCCRV
jgi:uncharacterized protein (UPF0262 family)